VVDGLVRAAAKVAMTTMTTLIEFIQQRGENSDLRELGGTGTVL